MQVFFRMFCGLAKWWDRSEGRRALAQRRAFSWTARAIAVLAFLLPFALVPQLRRLAEAPNGADLSATLWSTVLGAIVTPIAVLAFFLVLTLYSAARATVTKSVGPGSALPDDPLRGKLLEACGFRILDVGHGGLVAARGLTRSFWTNFGVESDWRDYPLRVEVSSLANGGLEVVAITFGGAAMVRSLAAMTADAVAAGDADAIFRCDETIAVRQGAGPYLGPLGSKIFAALFVSVVITIAAILPVIVASTNAIVADEARDDFMRAGKLWHQWLQERLTNPERVALVAAAQSGGSEAEGEDEGFRRMASQAQGANLVVARLRRGEVEVFQPPRGDPRRAEIEFVLRRVAREGPMPQTARKVGSDVLLQIDDPRLLPGKPRSRQYRYFFGATLSYDEVGRRASGMSDIPALMDSLYYFDSGAATLRLRFDGIKGAGPFPVGWLARADDAARTFSGEVPVLSSTEDRWEYPMRMDERWEPASANPSRFLLFEGSQGSSGLTGAVLAFEPRASYVEGITKWHAERLADRFFPLFGALLLTAFVAAMLLSRRMTKPLFEVRDALKRISGGDYTPRFEARRTDEIGQLQRLVGYTAEQLQRREAIKDLMGMYLSKQVAERIMKSGSTSSLAGVRTEVTVLFADIRGFTSYSENHAPEQVTRTLNEYFEVMVDVVAGHEGVLDKFIGDGIMVVFGAPVAQPDHAMRAVVTGLEMQAHLATLNLKRAQRGDEPIAIGIGVNTGIAISGNLGSLKRMEFTVVGDTVNTAARLENRAQKGEVLIGKNTYEKVAQLIHAEPLGALAVKGKSEGVEVWRVTGLAHATHQRLPAEVE